MFVGPIEITERARPRLRLPFAIAFSVFVIRRLGLSFLSGMLLFIIQSSLSLLFDSTNTTCSCQLRHTYHLLPNCSTLRSPLIQILAFSPQCYKTPIILTLCKPAMCHSVIPFRDHPVNGVPGRIMDYQTQSHSNPRTHFYLKNLSKQNSSSKNCHLSHDSEACHRNPSVPC